MSNACLTLCLISVLNVKALLDAFNRDYEPSDGPSFQALVGRVVGPKTNLS